MVLIRSSPARGSPAPLPPLLFPGCPQGQGQGEAGPGHPQPHTLSPCSPLAASLSPQEPVLVPPNAEPPPAELCRGGSGSPGARGSPRLPPGTRSIPGRAQPSPPSAEPSSSPLPELTCPWVTFASSGAGKAALPLPRGFYGPPGGRREERPGGDSSLWPTGGCFSLRAHRLHGLHHGEPPALQSKSLLLASRRVGGAMAESNRSVRRGSDTGAPWK